MKESDTGCKRLRNSNNCPHFFAEGEPRMPMLNRKRLKTATNGVDDVEVNILSEVPAAWLEELKMIILHSLINFGLTNDY